MRSGGKVTRWLEHLTDAQIHDLVATIDRALAAHGNDAGEIRKVLVHFCTHVPGRRVTLGSVPVLAERKSDAL